MVRAMRQHLTAEATPDQRRARLLRQYQLAEDDRQAILRHIAEHNRLYAPFRGLSLVLQEVPLETAQSTPA